MSMVWTSVGNGAQGKEVVDQGPSGGRARETVGEEPGAYVHHLADE